MTATLDGVLLSLLTTFSSLRHSWHVASTRPGGAPGRKKKPRGLMACRCETDSESATHALNANPRASPTRPHASYTHDPHRPFGYSSGPGRVSPVGNCLPCHQERYLKDDQRCGTFFPSPHQLFRAVLARQGCAWNIISSRFSGFGCQRMWLAQIHSELPHM